jgi:hypothetical protein
MPNNFKSVPNTGADSPSNNNGLGRYNFWEKKFVIMIESVVYSRYIIIKLNKYNLMKVILDLLF